MPGNVVLYELNFGKFQYLAFRKLILLSLHLCKGYSSRLVPMKVTCSAALRRVLETTNLCPGHLSLATGQQMSRAKDITFSLKRMWARKLCQSNLQSLSLHLRQKY
jgi:hypothetical protein